MCSRLASDASDKLLVPFINIESLHKYIFLLVDKYVFNKRNKYDISKK